MQPDAPHTDLSAHDHVFLGASHALNERRTWAAITLTLAMMSVEIAGGWYFGSLAVVADGFHMATHALALLIAALAYTFARRHATDRRFVFGTGKFGDLAGYTSAIILVFIALLIGYEAATRLFFPVPVYFREAIAIAIAGLIVNIATAWLLSAGGRNHAHAHTGHSSHRPHRHDDHEHSEKPASRVGRDYNMRAAFIHVAADAAVSVLVIIGLLLGAVFGLNWMDPAVALIGALVIGSWAYGLLRDTGSVLLDMNPDEAATEKVRRTIECSGDRLADLHVWRLGPGHLGAIVSIETDSLRDAEFYRSRLNHIAMLSHLTVEVRRVAGAHPGEF